MKNLRGGRLNKRGVVKGPRPPVLQVGPQKGCFFSILRTTMIIFNSEVLNINDLHQTCQGPSPGLPPVVVSVLESEIDGVVGAAAAGGESSIMEPRSILPNPMTDP